MRLSASKKTGDTPLTLTSKSISSYFGFPLLHPKASQLHINGELQVLISFLISLTNPDQLVIELPVVSEFAGTAFLWKLFIYIKE